MGFLDGLLVYFVGRTRQSRFFRRRRHGDFFGFDVSATRVLTVILQFLFPATFLVYLAMCILVPAKPGEIYRDKKEEQFWKSVRTSPVATVSAVRHKLREVDARLQKMERYVTSPGFNLDKEFRDLQDD